MNLKNLRKQNTNLTQIEFAQKLDIKYETYKSYELNKRTPPIEILDKIARYYNVSIDYLLDRQDTNGLNTQEYELLNMFRELNEFAQVQVIGFLKGQLASKQNLKQKTNFNNLQ